MKIDKELLERARKNLEGQAALLTDEDIAKIKEILDWQPPKKPRGRKAGRL
jgi:hypothetical protein